MRGLYWKCWKPACANIASRLRDSLTIIPLALMGSESIAHEAFGLSLGPHGLLTQSKIQLVGQKNI